MWVLWNSLSCCSAESSQHHEQECWWGRVKHVSTMVGSWQRMTNRQRWQSVTWTQTIQTDGTWWSCATLGFGRPKEQKPKDHSFMRCTESTAINRSNKWLSKINYIWIKNRIFSIDARNCTNRANYRFSTLDVFSKSFENKVYYLTITEYSFENIALLISFDSCTTRPCTLNSSLSYSMYRTSQRRILFKSAWWTVRQCFGWEKLELGRSEEMITTRQHQLFYY